MSDNNVCPKCGNDGEALKEALRDHIAEVDRLRAALKKAERESSYWRVASIQSMQERDEARKWARSFYQLWKEADNR